MADSSSSLSDLFAFSEAVPERKKKLPKQKDFIDVLRMLAPGTALRTAIDDILRANMGALIALDNGDLEDVIEKGFRINARFSSQRLVELAKMDGAIILSADAKRILYANTLLVPSLSVGTKETGTRHKAAERTARHKKAVTIAVSERKRKISVYSGEVRYVLAESSEVLRRASETMQILEKQREVFNDLLAHFNVLEITNAVTIQDLSSLLQRFEIIERISDTVRGYLIELGKEGILVSMRLRELTLHLHKEEVLLVRDYFGSRATEVLEQLDLFSLDALTDSQGIASHLFEDIHDRSIFPHGIRLFSKMKLSDRLMTLLFNKFSTFNVISAATEEDLVEVFGDAQMAEHFLDELSSLKEKILVGKSLS